MTLKISCDVINQNKSYHLLETNTLEKRGYVLYIK